MAKSALIVTIIAVIIVLAIAGIGILQLTSNNTGSNAGSVGTRAPSNTNPQTYTIDISNFAFSPSEIRIKQGDTIVWTNKDSVRHTVTSDAGSELDSSLLGHGESHSHTFSTAGTFSYHCSPHPYMKGKVIVE